MVLLAGALPASTPAQRTEFTIHGPVRVAVGLGPDGKVRGVAVVEETFPWVKVALDRDVTRPWIGQGSQGAFAAAGA